MMPLQPGSSIRETVEFHVTGSNRKELLANALILANEWYGDAMYHMNLGEVHRVWKTDAYGRDIPANPDAQDERLRVDNRYESITARSEWHGKATTYLHMENDY